MKNTMKKTAGAIVGLVALSFGVTLSVAAKASPEERSIRMFQTSSQLERAVADQKVFLDLKRNIILNRAEGSSLAKKRVQHVMSQRDSSGQVTKELVTRCDLSASTKSKKFSVAPTVRDAGTASASWRVKSIQRIDNSIEKWTLERRWSAPLVIMCRAFEREAGVETPVALTASMISRALSNVSGSLVTTVDPSEMLIQGEEFNSGIAQPSSSPSVSVQ